MRKGFQITGQCLLPNFLIEIYADVATQPFLWILNHIVTRNHAVIHSADEVEVGNLGTHQGEHLLSRCPTTKQVRSQTLQFPRAGATEDETDVLALDKRLHLIQQYGQFLYFVDDDGIVLSEVGQFLGQNLWVAEQSGKLRRT